ncbi:thioredoxin family protein [Methanoplanus sp. FWC-SCC4]|uniref:Thioredoxin family protein n=1 Tax=Methanochimaera problematica TaxID=2609417 RepID=A0AA97FES3_9EURY|nr:thioredoxin family protein [Methanoplanus sp. FWC-SCC4]WOF16101.1 thioredoxin family protein [Methanoplanus sp. FWC-SCC4]
MSANIPELNDSNWETFVEKNKKPVFIMFYSETCPHCRTMMPYFEQYAEEYGERVVFGLLNTDNSVWIREKYGVFSTPTFKYFCGGKPVGDIVGAVYPALLKRMIEDMIKNGSVCALKSTEIDYEITGYA